MSLRLAEDPMRLGPVPESLELLRRAQRSREVRLVLGQHLRKGHAVTSGTVRICTALEQASA